FLNNKSPTLVIFAGKAVSTTLMLLGGLTARYTFPKQMKAIDQAIGEVLAPMMKEETSPEKVADANASLHAERVVPDNKLTHVDKLAHANKLAHVEKLAASRHQAEIEPEMSR